MSQFDFKAGKVKKETITNFGQCSIKFVVTAINKATENVTLQLYTPLLSKEPGLGS